MTNYTFKTNSPIGLLTLSSDGKNLTGLWVEGQKYFGSTFNDATEKQLPLFDKVQNWLEKYFLAKQPEIDFPLAPQGTNFRQEVWEILCKIPYGEVTTYGEISKQIAKKRGVARISAQAVGGAIGHNPISIIIPCHRVVGVDGSLTGYAGGIEAKIKLLELENVKMDGFYTPKKGTAL